MPVPCAFPVLPSSTPLVDTFGRKIHSLRFSVTDRCNLRCVTCIPHGMKRLKKGEILSYVVISRLARIFSAVGVRRIRLNGGPAGETRKFLTRPAPI